MTSSEKIADALFDLVRHAPLEDQKYLFETLTEFRNTYGRSYSGVRKQPFARALIEAIESAERFTGEIAK